MADDEEKRIAAAPDATATLAERFAKLANTAHRIAIGITDAILRKIENEAVWLAEVEAALAEIEVTIRVKAQGTLVGHQAKGRQKDWSR